MVSIGEKNDTRFSLPFLDRFDVIQQGSKACTDFNAGTKDNEVSTHI